MRPCYLKEVTVKEYSKPVRYALAREHLVTLKFMVEGYYGWYPLEQSIGIVCNVDLPYQIPEHPIEKLTKLLRDGAIPYYFGYYYEDDGKLAHDIESLMEYSQRNITKL